MAADNILDSWKKLKLTDEEKQPIDLGITTENGDGARFKSDLILVGKFLTEKKINFDAMKNTLRLAWCVKGGVAFRKFEKNFYIFQFFNKNDLLRVLDGRPWSFDNQLLVIQSVNGDEQPSEIVFSHSPFWIRLLNVPLNRRDEQFAKETGDRFGGFVKIDRSDPLGWEETMRMKVMVDVHKPLRRGFLIRNSKNGDDECKWISVQYERLPIFCYGCGLLGHRVCECDKEYENEEDKAQYGVWLRSPTNGFMKADEYKRDEYEREQEMSRRDTCVLPSEFYINFDM